MTPIREGLTKLLLALIILILVFSNVSTALVPLSNASEKRIAREAVARLGPQRSYDFQIFLTPDHFLLKRGTLSYQGIYLIPMADSIGIAAKVNLSAAVSPESPSAPTVSLVNSTVEVKIGCYCHVWIDYLIVTTSSLTAGGLYTITITGSSGASYRSAKATVGITNQDVATDSGELFYAGHFNSAGYSGGSTILNGTFENLGYVGLAVWQLTVNFDFGSFHVGCANLDCLKFYTTLSPFQVESIPMSIQIPSSAASGSHNASIIARWVFFRPFVSDGITVYDPLGQPGPDFQAQASLIVKSEPLTQLVLSIFSFQNVGGAAALVFLLVGLVLVIRHIRRQYPVTEGPSTGSGPAPLVDAPATIVGSWTVNAGLYQ